MNSANVSLKLVAIPEKSIYCPANATFPGGKSQARDPIEQTEIITSQPALINALILALWFIM